MVILKICSVFARKNRTDYFPATGSAEKRGKTVGERGDGFSLTCRAPKNRPRPVGGAYMIYGLYPITIRSDDRLQAF